MMPGARRLFATLLAGLVLLASQGLAAAPLDRARPVGANIAPLLAAPDQTGTVRDFASLKGPRGLILLVSRSVRW